MLNKRVAIYIPGTTGVNMPASELQGKMVNHALTIFSNRFGGATAIDAKGAWVSQEHGLIVEPVVLVYAFTDNKGVENNVHAIKAFAGYVAKQMSQECVAVELCDELQFVSPAETLAEAA